MATAIDNEPALVKSHLQHYFSVFPQDIIYYNIGRNKDKSLVMSDLERAANTIIAIESRK